MVRKSVDLGVDRASVHSDSKVLPQERRTHSLLTELVSGVHWHLVSNAATDKVKFERPMLSP
jgi:hypothetical protein